MLERKIRFLTVRFRNRSGWKMTSMLAHPPAPEPPDPRRPPARAPRPVPPPTHAPRLIGTSARALSELDSVPAEPALAGPAAPVRSPQLGRAPAMNRPAARC